MPLRTLTHRGTEWTVWNVVPSPEYRLRVALSGRHQAGWLCFQSEAEKRRIAPVPEGWEEWPDEELALQLERAAVIVPRTEESAPEGGDASPPDSPPT